MISSFIQALFIKIQPNMSDQEKKQLRTYNLLNAEINPKFLSIYKANKKFLTEKVLFKEKRVGWNGG